MDAVSFNGSQNITLLLFLPHGELFYLFINLFSEEMIFYLILHSNQNYYRMISWQWVSYLVDIESIEESSEEESVTSIVSVTEAPESLEETLSSKSSSLEMAQVSCFRISSRSWKKLGKFQTSI